MNRQYKLLSSGEAVTQETRGYDEALGTTYSLRSKEDAPDYRFMPDPNLPPLQVTPELIESVKKDLPESLEEQRKRLVEQYQLPLRDVNVLMRIGLEDEKIVNADAVAYFEQLAKGRDAKVALNWVTQVLLRNLNSQELSFADNSVEASHLGNLIDLVEGGQCTSTTGSSLVKQMLRDARLLEPYASSTNPVLALLVDRDALALDSNEELTALCQQVIQDLPKESEKIRKGQEKVLARLIGEVMKRTKGRADAEVARTELMRLLKT
jgi:aspartyl-tRNA(Asn)/glutamyl-tRNA(Gln) amidotransferase subunit B